MIIKAYQSTLYFDKEVSKHLKLNPDKSIKFSQDKMKLKFQVANDVTGYTLTSGKNGTYTLCCHALFSKGFLKKGEYAFNRRGKFLELKRVCE